MAMTSQYPRGMRRLTIVGAIGLVLIVSGCGSASSVSSALSSAAGAASSAASAASSAASAASSAASAAASGGGGSAECSQLTQGDMANFIVGVQILAQADSSDSLAAIKNGTITNYSPESFGAILTKLQFLKNQPASVLGDPGPALDYYSAANNAVKAMLDSGTVTQAQLDAYKAQIGDVGSVVGKQTAIIAAVSQACPGLK